jgi:hypothetical protein
MAKTMKLLKDLLIVSKDYVIHRSESNDEDWTDVYLA